MKSERVIKSRSSSPYLLNRGCTNNLYKHKKSSERFRRVPVQYRTHTYENKEENCMYVRPIL